jgi:hypothetical protein
VVKATDTPVAMICSTEGSNTLDSVQAGAGRHVPQGDVIRLPSTARMSDGGSKGGAVELGGEQSTRRWVPGETADGRDGEAGPDVWAAD